MGGREDGVGGVKVSYSPCFLLSLLPKTYALLLPLQLSCGCSPPLGLAPSRSCPPWGWFVWTACPCSDSCPGL